MRARGAAVLVAAALSLAALVVADLPPAGPSLAATPESPPFCGTFPGAFPPRDRQVTDTLRWVLDRPLDRIEIRCVSSDSALAAGRIASEAEIRAWLQSPAQPVANTLQLSALYIETTNGVLHFDKGKPRPFGVAPFWEQGKFLVWFEDRRRKRWMFIAERP